MERPSFGSIVTRGIAEIPVSRASNIFLELETRELSAEEESIITQRVALQRKLLAEYEKREAQRKVIQVAEVFPQLSPSDIAQLLQLHPNEEDAIAAFTANPSLVDEHRSNQEKKAAAEPGEQALSAQSGEVRGSAMALLPEVPKCSRKGKRWVRQNIHVESAKNDAEPQAETSSANQPEASPPLAAVLQCGQIRTGAATACEEQEGPPCANGLLTQHCQAPELSARGAQARGPGLEHNVDPRQDATSGLPGCGDNKGVCKPNEHGDGSAFMRHEPLQRSRPRRRASAGVAELIQAMREPVEKPTPRKRRREGGALQHKAAAASQLNDADASACPDDEVICHAPVRKPRLGRVKKCSTKPVELLDLGKLRVADGWFNKGYIFPEGFRSSTAFRSSADIHRSCRHICSIEGEGAAFWPLPTFVIMADDSATPIVAKSATGAWTAILARITAAITARRKAGEDLPPPPGTAIPGPEFFGLTDPGITRAIEELDATCECATYWQGKRERQAYVRAHGREPEKRAPDVVRPSRALRADTSSEEELGDDDIIYATDASDVDDAPVTVNRWSAVDRAQRRRQRRGGAEEEDENGVANEEGVLGQVVDPITLQRVRRPAMSPWGHVMGMASWAAVLADTQRCPFTKQPLHKEQVGKAVAALDSQSERLGDGLCPLLQLILLTAENLERYKSRLRLQAWLERHTCPKLQRSEQ